MITEFKEEIISNAFNNIGFGDIVNQNVPVIVKQDFAVDDCYIIKAGTIGCMKKRIQHKVKFKDGFVIGYLTFTTPEKELCLEFKIFTKNNEVRVCNLAGDISLTDLLTIYDGKAVSAIKEYCEMGDNLFNCSCEYDRNIESKKELSVIGAFAVLICAFMSVCSLVNSAFMSEYFWRIITALCLVINVLLLAFVFYLTNKNYGGTKEARLMREKMKNLAEEVKIEEHKMMYGEE